MNYETKHKEPWGTGEVYLNKDIILSDPGKAMDYAKVKDAHTEMMAKYVWVHHIELEAHFAPVGYINRSEIFNLPDGKRNPMWPESEGKTIFHRILKTAENNGYIFYRVPYLESQEYYEDLKEYIIPELQKKRGNIREAKLLKDKEKKFVANDGKTLLINPKMAYNTEEKWIKVAKDDIESQEKTEKMLQKMIDENIQEFKEEMEEAR